VAIHGAGKAAAAHLAAWLRRDDARIVSVGSRTRASAERLIARGNVAAEVHDRLDDALADPRVDVVCLTGPNHVHAEQAVAAAVAGKHLVIEKPMGVSLEHLRAVRDAVARAGVRSVVGFVLRWNPAVRNWKALLAGGAVGRLFYLEADYWHGVGPTHPGWHWVSRRATAGSAMLWAGCHAVDLLRYLAGDEVVEVSAYADNPRGGFEFPSNVVALLRFRGGAIGKVSTLLDCAMPYTLNVDLLGDAGALRDRRIWSRRLFPGQTGWTSAATLLPDSADVSHHPYDAMLEHFVESIRSGVAAHADVADAYPTHEVCMAIDRSAAAGGIPVRLPLEM
jgi:UDP-N-acetyl-2-amino-2-deoxyglucuronate dehydrogenase